MKWNRKNKPSVGDKRVMIGFLWWPKKAYSIKCDCSQWRWLEKAMWIDTVEEEYVALPGGFCAGFIKVWKIEKWFETD